MKSKLRTEQESHAVRTAKLILWCTENDIGLTLGDGFRDERVHGKWGEKKGYGSAVSLHKLKLAQDLNVIAPEIHERMHDKWDELGGAKRIAEDMNHYASGWQGYR